MNYKRVVLVYKQTLKQAQRIILAWQVDVFIKIIACIFIGRIRLFNLIVGLVVFANFIINPLIVCKNPRQLGSKPVRQLAIAARARKRQRRWGHALLIIRGNFNKSSLRNKWYRSRGNFSESFSTGQYLWRGQLGYTSGLYTTYNRTTLMFIFILKLVKVYILGLRRKGYFVNSIGAITRTTQTYREVSSGVVLVALRTKLRRRELQIYFIA